MDGITEYLKSLYCAAIADNHGQELPDKYKAVIYTTQTDNAQEFARSGCRLPSFHDWLLQLRDQIDESLQTWSTTAEDAANQTAEDQNATGSP